MMLTRNTSKLRRQVAEHVAADQVVQGDYWNIYTQKGCFIGCLTHDSDPVIAEESFGLPVMVQKIAEDIFEALPAKDAKLFFAALPDAVACDGKDLARVGWRFLAAELRALPEMPAEIQVVIDPVIAGIDLLASGQPWPAKAAIDAADAATDAARAAAAAASAATAAAWAAAAWAATAAVWAARAASWAAAGRSANAAATAASSAKAARAAADAARAAADAARAAKAAAEAAEAAACRRQRDLLLRLISEAPVVGVEQ